MIGIYSIQNKTNGKRYIGRSVNIESRWKEHKKINREKNLLAKREYYSLNKEKMRKRSRDFDRKKRDILKNEK